MVYKLQDIKHLELMESLATREDSKVALEQEIKLESEVSFDESILKLCSGLRAKGFDKNADALEEKFLAFKAAANTHLYRAHDEDGEDVIHFAHPDGDAHTNDGDLGDVETITSKHKKIVDVVQKAPTGKLAVYVKQCKVVLAQQAGISAQDLINGLRGGAAKLSTYSNFIGQMLNEPELANNEQLASTFETTKDAISSLVVWVSEMFKMAEGASKRGTELNPSLSQITAQDINNVLTQDPRYSEFSGFLTVSVSPNELFGKFNSLVNYVRAKILQTINSVENPEIKKNMLSRFSSPQSTHSGPQNISFDVKGR